MVFKREHEDKTGDSVRHSSAISKFRVDWIKTMDIIWNYFGPGNTITPSTNSVME